MTKSNLLLTLIFLFSVSFSFAQKTDKLSKVLAKKVLATETNNEMTVWIYFTDKGDNINQKLALAEQTIGERSLARRQRSLKNKALVTFYDIPVSTNYIEAVSPLLSKLRHQSKWLNAISAKVNKSKLQEIAALDFVKSIDIVRKGSRTKMEAPETIETTNNKTNEKLLYDLDYGPSLTQNEQMNVPLVHDLGYTGDGIIVCLMDSGFRNYDTHPIFDNMDIMDTYDFVNDDTNVDDEGDMGTGGHGLSTLSTAGGFAEGQLIGPAFGATFLLAKTENTDSETTVEEDNWVAAAEWAEALGADITSTSLGYLGFDDGTGYEPEDLDGNTSTITIAADILAGMGVLVINSAGNSGGGTTTIGAPADGFNVLAIGAVNSNGNKAGFSSVGPTADGRIKPDVMAMGASDVVANGEDTYGTSSGTSFSCPLVAGASALLWEMVPTATSTEIFDALKMSADNADSPNNDYGWGIINIYAAFELLTNTSDTEAPMAACQNTTAELNIDGIAIVDANDVDNGSTDNIAIISYALDIDAFNCDNLGDVNVVLTITDASGNTDNCDATVSIVDNMSPIFDIQILADVNAECEVTTLNNPTAFDNCAGPITATHDTSLPITTSGTTVITWSYDDGNGNTIFQNQNVVINDVTNPTVLTQNITIDLAGASSISIVPSQIDAGSTDNCGINELTLDINTFTEIGEYTVQLNAEDFNNNTSANSAIVTVINSVLSVEDDIFASSLNIYPNPATDIVIIKAENETIKSVVVYATSGKMLKEFSTNTIDVSAFTPGTYYLNITTESEKKAYKEIVIFDK